MLRGRKGPYPYHEGRHVIVAAEFFTYADESGWHQGAKYCIVAGFIGSPRQWKIFEKEWVSILQRFEVSDFHSKDFFGRNKRQQSSKNQYLGWSAKKANQFLDELTTTIWSRQIYPIGSAG